MKRFDDVEAQFGHFGFLYLPEQEVAEAHFSRSANQEVGVGRTAGVQALAQQRFGDVTSENTRQ